MSDMNKEAEMNDPYYGDGEECPSCGETRTSCECDHPESRREQPKGKLYKIKPIDWQDYVTGRSYVADTIAGRLMYGRSDAKGFFYSWETDRDFGGEEHLKSLEVARQKVEEYRLGVLLGELEEAG